MSFYSVADYPKTFFTKVLYFPLKQLLFHLLRLLSYQRAQHTSSPTVLRKKGLQPFMYLTYLLEYCRLLIIRTGTLFRN